MMKRSKPTCDVLEAARIAHGELRDTYHSDDIVLQVTDEDTGFAFITFSGIPQAKSGLTISVGENDLSVCPSNLDLATVIVERVKSIMLYTGTGAIARGEPVDAEDNFNPVPIPNPHRKPTK